MSPQPRVLLNDWVSLSPPPAPATPHLTASFVIAAHNPESLDHVLAALVAQTYPQHLVEVVVVDDGSDPPVRLPELRPERTRLLRATGEWGKPNACNQGAAVAEGDVIHWLDADMVLAPEELERHMRWHHLVDHAVVMGAKTFLDPAEGLPSPAELHRLLAAGEDPFAGDRWLAPHDWIEEYVADTARLTAKPHRSYLVHVGAATSVRRDLFEATGGMDVRLKLGEDIELGYRLAQKGALFVPADEARSWHLGRSLVMDRELEVNHRNRPWLRDLISDMRHWRPRGRIYTVPWFEVVVDARGHDYESVMHTVEGCLTGNPTDLRVTVVGAWSRPPSERHHPIDDPWQDVRMLAAEYASEPRVRLVEELPGSAFPSMFRVWLPVGWAPSRNSLRVLLRDRVGDHGLVRIPLADGREVRVERTSSFERAARILGCDLVPYPAGYADLDACVTDVAGSLVVDDLEPPFLPFAPRSEAPSAAGGTRPASSSDASGMQSAATAAPRPGSGDNPRSTKPGRAEDGETMGAAGSVLGRFVRAARGRRTP